MIRQGDNDLGSGAADMFPRKLSVYRRAAHREGRCNFCTRDHRPDELVYCLTSEGHPALRVRMCQPCRDSLLEQTRIYDKD